MVNYTPKLINEKKMSGTHEILVKDIMHRVFTAFSEDMDILEASRTLIKKKITGAPVINKAREAVGFLSEKDCLRFTMDMKYHNDEPGKVSDYMSRVIISVPPAADIYYATDLFTKNPFYSYPVVENNKVVGILYRHAVLRKVCRMVQSTW